MALAEDGRLLLGAELPGREAEERLGRPAGRLPRATAASGCRRCSRRRRRCGPRPGSPARDTWPCRSASRSCPRGSRRRRPRRRPRRPCRNRRTSAGRRTPSARSRRGSSSSRAGWGSSTRTLPGAIIDGHQQRRAAGGEDQRGRVAASINGHWPAYHGGTVAPQSERPGRKRRLRNGMAISAIHPPVVTRPSESQTWS